MKRIVMAYLCLALAGCANLTEGQREAITIGVAVVIYAVAAHQNEAGETAPKLAIGPPPKPPCHMQPDGTCRP